MEHSSSGSNFGRIGHARIRYSASGSPDTAHPSPSFVLTNERTHSSARFTCALFSTPHPAYSMRCYFAYKLARTPLRGAIGNGSTLIFERQGSKFNCLVSGSAVISCTDDHSDGHSPEPETTLRSRPNVDAPSRSHTHVRPRRRLPRCQCTDERRIGVALADDDIGFIWRSTARSQRRGIHKERSAGARTCMCNQVNASR